MYGYNQEYLYHKIETFKRFCWRVGELVNMVNDELYAMHIPKDACIAWGLLWTVHSICLKLCKKYTNFDHETAILPEKDDSLECIREIKCMIAHLKIASLHNPQENITAKSINLMTRLFARCSSVMEKYLKYIEDTHRNVEAE